MLPGGVLLAAGLVGGITTVLTGAMALASTDLKRLLAASTSSQYGLMLVAVGAGAPLAALLHLITHATNKSALFLGAGIFQRDRGSTALDDLGGAGPARPGVFAGFTLAALALAGIPPLAGFFSKDAIIAAALATPLATLLAPLALLGVLLTGAYMGRALAVLWHGEVEGAPGPVPLMAAGMGGLVVLAAGLGAGVSPLEQLVGMGMPEVGLAAPTLGVAGAVSGLSLGWFLSPARLLGPLLRPAQEGFAIAGGMDGLVARPAFAVAAACERAEGWLLDAVLAAGRAGLAAARATLRFDAKRIDGLVFGLARGSIAAGARLRRLQSGLIHREMALTAIGTLVMVGLLLVAMQP
jgi:NADH-quinone oxidoreductase subunit L